MAEIACITAVAGCCALGTCCQTQLNSLCFCPTRNGSLLVHGDFNHKTYCQVLQTHANDYSRGRVLMLSVKKYAFMYLTDHKSQSEVQGKCDTLIKDFVQ